MKSDLLRFRVPPRPAVVFLLAFLLPTLLFAWLAFNTIMERRQAVQRLLASAILAAADHEIS